MDATDTSISTGYPDFTKDDLVSQDDPYPQFHHWFKQAVECDAIPIPNSMALATCTASAIPSVRMVLMTEMGPNGLVFCTDQYSRKGRELEENPNASVVFYWKPLDRQIRVEGKIRKLSDEESTRYFKTESRPLQVLVASVERQSVVIENKTVLKQEYEKTQQKYADESVPIPKPPNWMGYVIEPSCFEFLQAHTNCLQDRIVFVRQSDSTWTVQRLTP
ncbi:pyridoxine/pyridoxamine 5'-phosphate oxidase-like [Dysidea avara]|uniref:pyridoxine/pyridoxamine 5'-phosphate oxidase-like n=1 Tax=Dysidea avara TaxID=196820 RepID=UPI003324B1A5